MSSFEWHTLIAAAVLESLPTSCLLAAAFHLLTRSAAQPQQQQQQQQRPIPPQQPSPGRVLPPFPRHPSQPPTALPIVQLDPHPPFLPSAQQSQDPPFPGHGMGANQSPPPSGLRIVELQPYPPSASQQQRYSQQLSPNQAWPSQSTSSPHDQPFQGPQGQAQGPNQQQQQLPLLKGPGTKSGPWTGYASKAWLQAEFRKDVDDLRQHVDEYTSKREHRAFDLERSALQAEIANLRKQLQESEDKVAKLELMLPDDNGEFKALKNELDELEKEADYFSDLYAQQAKATQTALEGFRQAIAGINDIEAELDNMQNIIASLPEPQQQPQQQLQQQQQYYAPAPPVATSPRCCGCFPLGRR